MTGGGAAGCALRRGRGTARRGHARSAEAQRGSRPGISTPLVGIRIAASGGPMAPGSVADDAERWPLLSERPAPDIDESSRSRRTSVNSVQSDFGQRARRESQMSLGRSSQSSVSAWISEHDGAYAHADDDTARILARDWEASQVHVRTALLARASSKARLTAPARSQVSPHDNKMARVRRRIVTIMEANCTQMIMITLILVEMLAVLFELLLEIGFLSFNDKIDQPLINTLHYISVSILSLFVVEFGVYFFALGFKFCCRA